MFHDDRIGTGRVCPRRGLAAWDLSATATCAAVDAPCSRLQRARTRDHELRLAQPQVELCGRLGQRTLLPNPLTRGLLAPLATSETSQGRRRSLEELGGRRSSCGDGQIIGAHVA